MPLRIALSPDLQRYVEEQVALGLYADASATVAAALRLMRQQEQERRDQHDALRREVGEGVAQADAGDTAVLDWEQLRRRGRERLGQRREPG